MSDEPTPTQIIDELRGVLTLAHDELDRLRSAVMDAARVLVQKDAHIGILESQLGSTHEQLTILQDASRPAAVLLFNLTQQPGIDDRVRETIAQTLAPLDAALAAIGHEKARDG